MIQLFQYFQQTQDFSVMSLSDANSVIETFCVILTPPIPLLAQLPMHFILFYIPTFAFYTFLKITRIKIEKSFLYILKTLC